MLNKFTVADLPVHQLVSKHGAEHYSASQSLSDAAELTQLLVHREVILPGQRASAPHRHSHKEELFWVLSGIATLYCGQHNIAVSEGEFIGIKPGREYHFIANQGTEALIILSVGSHNQADVTEFAPLEMPAESAE